MELDVERYVASVTIISGTLPAQQVAKKYVFPVGRENIVQNVSVFHFFYLNLIINSNSLVVFVYYFISFLLQ